MKMQVRNVDFFYGDFQALHSVNMDIEEGKITALIGPSGCGKSTFLRNLNRMNDLIDKAKVTGEMLLDGESIMDGNVDVNQLRRRVGMVFQKPNPFPKSIFENVVYGPKKHGIKNRSELMRICEEALRGAALWDEVKDKLSKSAMALSGGQQQRLCIARCLAMKPEVLLMDEPTSALDPIATQKIEDLFQRLKKDYTIVIVTHSMQQAGRISDKTGFFLNGDLVEFGDTDQIFTNPRNKKTEDYITGRFG